MEVSKILAELDRQIERLKAARALLTGTSANRTSAQRAAATEGKKKRTMSATGRRRIGEAMKRRWAERRKAAEKNGK